MNCLNGEPLGRFVHCLDAVARRKWRVKIAKEENEMNSKVYLVQALEGSGDATTLISYCGVFTTWEAAVCAAGKLYFVEFEPEFAKPEESGHLYAERIYSFGDNRWCSVRIIPMMLDKQYNIA